jgi:hypothetical protein
MTIDHRRRLELYEAARRNLGEDAAGTLMVLLPVDHSELATRRDLDGLRGEFAVLRGEFGELRGEFGELRGEFGELRGEVRAEIATLRTEMHDLLREQTNRMLMFVLPTMLSGIGLAFAAARFGA